ncbi:MAG TPA: LPS assembly protein LptD [Opitutaceae bacterium]|jgi:LPS-assembly protein
MRPIAFVLIALAVTGVAHARKAKPPVLDDQAENLAPIQMSGARYSADLDGNVDVVGGVNWRQGHLLVTADQMHYERATNTIVARGDVVVTQDDVRMLADYLEYHRTQGTFVAKDVRIGRYPVYIQGLDAEGTMHEVTIHKAVVSFTDPGRWKPSLKAGTIVYSPGHYLRTVKSLIGMNGVGIIPLGNFRETLNEAVSAQILTLEAGYRSHLGPSLTVGYHLPFFDDSAHLGGDVSEYIRRGVMAGPSGTYADPDGSQDWYGSLQSGFIDDVGKKGIDVTGANIPNGRGFVTWEHTQEISQEWSIDGQLNYWTDSSVTRDFRPQEFLPVQTPDTDLEILHSGPDDFASLFVRPQVNDWEDVVQRLPELSYTLAPLNIGGGFYERGEASAVHLEENPPTVLDQPNLAENRLDAFYRISRPIVAGNWFNFTPIAGVRETDYFDTQGALVGNHYIRTLGEVGFDSQLEASGVFDYQNATWGIDGLRHLFIPSISYRYIPGSATGNESIPDIDQLSYSTYLQPLELGDDRDIDQLGPRNTMRIGLDNILQTRDDGYGSRNLIDFDVADDVNFTKPQPYFENYSNDMHTEMLLTPARWIEIDAAHVFNPATFTLYEFDAGLTLRDGDQWSARIAGDFLRHETDDYLFEYRYRLTEEYQAVLNVEYGARSHVLNTVQLGIVQNLGNTWRVQWLLTRNGGPNREGRYGANVEVDVYRF